MDHILYWDTYVHTISCSVYSLKNQEDKVVISTYSPSPKKAPSSWRTDPKREYHIILFSSMFISHLKEHCGQRLRELLDDEFILSVSISSAYFRSRYSSFLLSHYSNFIVWNKNTSARCSCTAFRQIEHICYTHDVKKKTDCS